MPKFGQKAGNEIIWIVECLRPYGSEITEFLRLKQRHDQAFLGGNPAEIEDSLSAIEKHSGASLWLAEATINFLQRYRGYRDQRQFADELQSTKGMHPLLQYVVSWLSYRASQNMLPDEFHRLLEEVAAPDSGFAVLTHIALGNSKAVSPTNLAATVAFTDVFPPIDRYLLFTKALQSYVANSNESWPWLEVIKTELLELSHFVGDRATIRTLLAVGVPLPTKRACSTTPIHDEIAAGHYSEAASLAAAILEKNISIEAIYALRLAENIGGLEPSSVLSSLSGPASEIGEDIGSLISQSSDAGEAADRLLKVSFVNLSCEWASSLALIVRRMFDDDRLAESDRSNLYLALRSQHDDPRFAFYFRSLGPIESYLQTFTSQTSSSLYLVRSALSDAADFSEYKTILPSVIAEWQAVWHLMRANGQAAAECLEIAHQNESSGFLKRSLGRLLMVSLLLRGDLVSCAKVAIELFLSSDFFARLLPFKELARRIISEVDDHPRGRALYSHLPVVLTIDVASRFVSLRFEADRVDAFKDFLIARGVRFASELVNVADEFPREELVQFLKFVCVPEVLDQSLALESTRAVEDERSRILVLLNELTTMEGKPPSSELLDELSTIKTKQVVRETTLRLDQSKIYVNIEGLKRTVNIATRDSWRRYELLTLQQKTISIAGLQEAIQAALGEKIEILSLTLPLTEANKLFARMVFELRDLFTTSKEFGLDANLSTNIRHGFVMRELRGPFLQHHLVTNKISQDGGYLANKHWMDRLEDLSDDQQALVSDALARFSERVDAQIEYLNRRLIRIRSELVPEGLFDFSINDLSMQLIQRNCEKAQDYDEFIDAILEALWTITNAGLDDLKKVLSALSHANLLLALEQLSEDLHQLRDRDEVAALLSSVNLVRPDLSSAITRVASWFALSGNTEYQDYDLEISCEAGLATVRSYYSHLTIQSQFRQERPTMMMGRTLPFLSRLFSIIIENSAYHSGLTSGVLRITTSADVSGDVLLLTIRNNLAPSVDLDHVRERISFVNTEFGRENAARLIREEGGSGYPKIWKILAHDMGGVHALHVSLTPEDEFLVEIMVDAKAVLL